MDPKPDLSANPTPEPPAAGTPSVIVPSASPEIVPAASPEPVTVIPVADTETLLSSPEVSVAPSSGGTVISPIEPTPAPAPTALETPFTATPSPEAHIFGAPPQAYANQSAPKKGKKKFVLAGAIVGLLLLVGGGAAAYQYVLVPTQTKNLFKKVVAINLDQTKLKSGNFEGSLDLSGKDIPAPFQQLDLTGSFAGEKSTMNISTKAPKIGLDLLVPDSKSMYVRASLDPTVLAGLAGSGQANPAMAMYLPIVQSINGQWLSFSSSDYAALGAGAAPAFTLSQAEGKKISAAFDQHIFLKVQKMYADEKIHGVDSHHATVILDNTELAAFIEALHHAKSDLVKDMKDSDLKTMKEKIAKTDFTKYPVEAWIAKDTYFITQLKFKTTVSSVGVSARIALKDFNKSIDIKKPENAKSIMDLYMSMAGPAAMSSMQATPGAAQSASPAP